MYGDTHGMLPPERPLAVPERACIALIAMVMAAAGNDGKRELSACVNALRPSDPTAAAWLVSVINKTGAVF